MSARRRSSGLPAENVPDSSSAAEGLTISATSSALAGRVSQSGSTMGAPVSDAADALSAGSSPLRSRQTGSPVSPAPSGHNGLSTSHTRSYQHLLGRSR